MKKITKIDSVVVDCNGYSLDEFIEKLNTEKQVLIAQGWESLMVELEKNYDYDSENIEFVISGNRPMNSKELESYKKKKEEEKNQFKKDMKLYVELREKFKDVPESVLTGEGFDVLEDGEPDVENGTYLIGRR